MAINDFKGSNLFGGRGANPLAFPIKETIRLSGPTNPPKTDLLSIIAERRSNRAFKSLSLKMLGSILFSSAKVKDFYIQENGYILTKRPSPSAGARHPIDLILMTPILNNGRQVYYYNPFEHSLNGLDIDPVLVSRFKDHITTITDIGDGTILWLVAHENRTGANYENPMPLIWRDAGALIQCIQLASTAYEINSCAVGSLGEPDISGFFWGPDMYSELGG